jgi:hypothetical protein
MVITDSKRNKTMEKNMEKNRKKKDRLRIHRR